jgi:hypothetical protein
MAETAHSAISQNKRLALAFCEIYQKNKLDKALREIVETESLHQMMFRANQAVGALDLN